MNTFSHLQLCLQTHIFKATYNCYIYERSVKILCVKTLCDLNYFIIIDYKLIYNNILSIEDLYMWIIIFIHSDS